MRSALKNRVHALIAVEGIQRAHAELFGAGGRASWTTSGYDQIPRPFERAAGLIADFSLLGTAALEAVVSQQILRRGAALWALLAPEENGSSRRRRE
jgi:hypothetical protein